VSQKRHLNISTDIHVPEDGLSYELRLTTMQFRTDGFYLIVHGLIYPQQNLLHWLLGIGHQSSPVFTLTYLYRLVPGIQVPKVAFHG
jgi:hypothetical protein